MACMMSQAGGFSIHYCPLRTRSVVTPELTLSASPPRPPYLVSTFFFQSGVARNLEHCASASGASSSVIVSELGCIGRKRKEGRRIVVAKGGEQSGGVETQTTVRGGGVSEACKDTFWPTVEEAGKDTVVVLDMFTQWCGPCKLIAPKIEELSYRYTDVIFLKLDCNQGNKPLAKELGIRAVPTFKILQNNKVVAEVVGAKFDDLVAAIDKARTSPSP